MTAWPNYKDYIVLFIDSKLKEQKAIKDIKKSSDRETKQLSSSSTFVSIIFVSFTIFLKVFLLIS